MRESGASQWRFMRGFCLFGPRAVFRFHLSIRRRERTSSPAARGRRPLIQTPGEHLNHRESREACAREFLFDWRFVHRYMS